MLTYYENQNWELLEKKVDQALSKITTNPDFYKFEGLSFDSISGVLAAAVTNNKLRREQKKCKKELEKIFDNKLSIDKMNEIITSYNANLKKEIKTILPKIIVPPSIDKKNYEDFYKGQAVFALSSIDLRQSAIASIEADTFFNGNLKHDVLNFYLLLGKTNALTGKDESAIGINDIAPSYKVNVQQVGQTLNMDCRFHFTADGLNEFISYAKEKGTIKAVMDFNSQLASVNGRASLFDSVRTASIVNKLRSQELEKPKRPKNKVRERDARELVLEKSKPFEMTGRYM